MIGKQVMVWLKKACKNDHVDKALSILDLHIVEVVCIWWIFCIRPKLWRWCILVHDWCLRLTLIIHTIKPNHISVTRIYIKYFTIEKIMLTSVFDMSSTRYKHQQSSIISSKYSFLIIVIAGLYNKGSLWPCLLSTL